MKLFFQKVFTALYIISIYGKWVAAASIAYITLFLCGWTAAKIAFGLLTIFLWIEFAGLWLERKDITCTRFLLTVFYTIFWLSLFAI